MNKIKVNLQEEDNILHGDFENVNAGMDQQVINQDAVANNASTNTEAVANDDAPLNQDAFDIVNETEGAPTEEEAEHQQKVEQLHEECRVSIETPYPEEVCVLEVDGVQFFAKGDIHALKAKQKSGKTNAIAIMIAAILCGQWHRVKGIIENARVLLVDTEQKASDTQAIYRKILTMAGLPLQDRFDRLEVYSMRKLTSKERCEALETLIKENHPDIVFLDGIVDLSCDFNEVSDSQSLIQMLMTLSTEYNCAIVNVLHTNKANEDHNMRGHLGTMLGQKAGNVLECIKVDGGYITVRSADSRHAPVPEWSFCFADDGSLQCADDNARVAELNKAKDAAEKKLLQKEKQSEERLKNCKLIFAEHNSIMESAAFKKLYAEKSKVDISTARSHVRQLIAEGKLHEELNQIRLAGEQEQKLLFRD